MTERRPSPIRFDVPLDTVEWRLLAVPLPRPIFLGSVRITERQYLWVQVRDAEGGSGASYAFTRGLPLDSILEPAARLAVHEDYSSPGEFMGIILDHFRFSGPNGLVSRAGSVINLAMWDLYGRGQRRPIWNVLGATSRSSNVVMVVGYRREGEGIAEVQRQVEEAEAHGCWAIKIMTGSRAPQEDVRYIAEALRGFKGGTRIWVDINGAWPPALEAYHAVASLGSLGVSLLEEPYPTTAPLQAVKELCEEGGVPLAIGEFDHDPRILLTYPQMGVDVIRCDATTVGGVESWLAVSAELETKGQPIFPHFFPEVHSHLAVSVPNGLATELVPAWTTGLSTLARWPSDVRGEKLTLADDPGFGIEWQMDAIERYTARMGKVARS